MYAFKALIALKSRAMRGSKARLRTSAAHAPPQPGGGGVARDARKAGTAFRRVRPLIAVGDHEPTG